MWSDDLEKRSVALYLAGKVKPHISLKPGGYLSLWGVKGRIPSQHLEITNNHDKPLKIKCIESDLKDRIRWTLKEAKAGYIYRLEVVDISKTTGDYTGHLYVRTDNTLKPELVIIINGHVSEK